MVYYCCYGECKSDSRKKETAVKFLSFPKLLSNPDAAKRWAFLCGRGIKFTADHITKDTYICSKHFPLGSVLDIRKNPSLEPFNARWSAEKTAKEVGGHRGPHMPQSADGEVRFYLKHYSPEPLFDSFLLYLREGLGRPRTKTSKKMMTMKDVETSDTKMAKMRITLKATKMRKSAETTGCVAYAMHN
jgi:hypothetical protein